MTQGTNKSTKSIVGLKQKQKQKLFWYEGESNPL